MNITGSEKFEKFCKKYNDAQPALEKWVTKVTKASWKNHCLLYTSDAADEL